MMTSFIVKPSYQSVSFTAEKNPFFFFFGGMSAPFYAWTSFQKTTEK